MKTNILHLLIAGEYLCEVRYPNEFNSLANSSSQAEEVSRNLAPFDLRLARLNKDADGAFFAAPLDYTEAFASSIRADMRNFKSVYVPAIRMLDCIRKIRAEHALCTAGERIQLVELETSVMASSNLSADLKALLEIIHNGSPRVSDRENLKRLMDHLTKDGYMIVVDKGCDTYQVTGKIEQLYAALDFLDDNEVIEPDGEQNDQLDLLDALDSGELLA